MVKRIIRLTEADLENIVRKVLIEQDITQTPDRKSLLGQLEDKIISFLEDNRKNEFLTKIKISIDLKDVDVNDNNTPDWAIEDKIGRPVITITDANGKKLISRELDYYFVKSSDYMIRNYGIERDYYPGVFMVNTDGGDMLSNSGLYIGDFINEIIGEDKVLKDFYEREPGVKEQVDSLPIMYQLVLNDGNYAAKIQAKVTPEGGWEKVVDGVKRIFAPKKLSNKVTQGNTTTMDKAFYGRSYEISRFFDIGDYKVWLGIAPMRMPLYKLNITTAFKELDGGTPPTPPPHTGTTVADRDIELDLVDVFKYDTTDFKDETSYNEKIEEFKKTIAGGLRQFRGYEDYLKGLTLVVNGYASQDGDPTAEDGGYLPACSKYGKGKGPRSEYNKCLSQERAQRVADDLQKIFDELVGTGKIQVNAKGNGETHDFKGRAWNKIDGKDIESNLSENRRVTFKIPKYTERI